MATEMLTQASARGARRTFPALGRRTRTAVLIVHVLAASAWIGVDVIVAVLVGVGGLADDPALQGLAYRALATFVVTPMAVAAITSLVTGLVLGLGTRWGLVRYWWVAVKLVLNALMVVLVFVLLRPAMAEVGAAGDALSTTGATTADLTFLVFPPAVSLSMLTLAVVLAIAKPWGRIRQRQRAGAGSATSRA